MTTTPLNRADGFDQTLEELKADIAVAKTKFSQSNFCFTHVTVQALVDKIEELQAIVKSSEGQPTVGIINSINANQG